MAKRKRIYAGEKSAGNSPELIDVGEFTDGNVFLERDSASMSTSTGLKFYASPSEDAPTYGLYNGFVAAPTSYLNNCVVDYSRVQTFHAASGDYDTGSHFAVEIPPSRVVGTGAIVSGGEGQSATNIYKQDSKLPAYFAVTHTFGTLKYTYELHQQRKIR
tara:strand:+ start:27 stop:506 length:480 start_codon:yes stop_codon:yes gene_type:complete